jgi:hypothetical protein
MQPAGEISVEPVGRSDPGQQPRRRTAVVPAEEQIEEQR